jgi:hypothetical protein
VFWQFNKYDEKNALSHLKHVFRVRTQRPNISTDMLIVNLSEKPYITVEELKSKFTSFDYYIKTKFFKGFNKDIEKVEEINAYFKELDKKYANRNLKSVNYICEFVFSVLGDVLKKDNDDASLNELVKWFNKVNEFALNRLLLDTENIFMDYIYSILHLDENHPHVHILLPAILKNGNHYRLKSSTYQVYLDYKNLLQENNWYVQYNTPKRRRASLAEYQKAIRLGFTEQEIDMFLRLERMFVLDLNHKNIYKQYFEKQIPILQSAKNSDQMLEDLMKSLIIRSSIQWNELHEFKQKYRPAYDLLTSYLDKKNYLVEDMEEPIISTVKNDIKESINEEHSNVHKE